MPDPEANARPLILAVDTSSRFTSLALARGDDFIAVLGTELSNKRSERLWHQVDFLLGEAGIGIGDIQLFAACAGPGGFTGLRVGIAAIKGFGTATRKPVIGITSLEAAAFAARPAPTVCAIVNAYRGEVYVQPFSRGRDGMPEPAGQPLVLPPEKVVELVPVDEEVVFAGDGASALTSLIAGFDRWTIAQTPVFLADQIAILAFLKSSRGLGESEGLRACYVRPSEAEIKLSRGTDFSL